MKKRNTKKITTVAATKLGKDLGAAARKSRETINALVNLIVERSGVVTTLHNEEFGNHESIKLFKNNDQKGEDELRFSSRTGSSMTVRLNQVKIAILEAQAQGWRAYLHKPLSVPQCDASIAYLICIPSFDIQTQTRQQWQRDFLVTALKKRGKGKTKFKVLYKFFTFFDQPIIEEVLAHFSLSWNIKEERKKYYQFTKKKR